MLAPVEMIMETDVLQSYGEIQKLEMTVLSQDSSETVHYFRTICGKEKMKAVHLPFEFIVTKKPKPIMNYRGMITIYLHQQDRKVVINTECSTFRNKCWQ